MHTHPPPLVEWMEEAGKVVFGGELCPFPGWGGGQREGDRGLVQMNNLYGIPGIVCQGDDGRPVSKPKQTDDENTHTPS